MGSDHLVAAASAEPATEHTVTRQQFDAVAARMLIELVPGLAARIDDAGRFLFIADASLRFLEYSREYLDHASLFEITCAEDVPLLQRALRLAAESGQTQTCALRLLRSLTRPIWVPLRIAPSALAGGAVHFLVAGRDTTDAKEIAKRLHG